MKVWLRPHRTGYVACALLMAAGMAFAQAQAPKRDMSCGYFSADPDNTSGPPIAFYADLSADEESAVTHSPGVGRVDFVLERDTLNFTWILTYGNLTSAATGVHVHGPQTPGGEAAILFDLAPDGVSSPIRGSAVLNEGELAYLISDRMYVNLHTARYPAGELRGSIRKARPKC